MPKKFPPPALDAEIPDVSDVIDTLELLTGRYGRFLDAQAASYRANFRNSYIELFTVFRNFDGELYEDLVPRVYVDGPKDKSELGLVEDVDWLDHDEALTPYGAWLAQLRFCVGWVGNLSEGKTIDKASVGALAFVYEAYWLLGSDFTLGCVVEAPLKRISAKQGWGAVEAMTGDAVQDLGREIALAIRELYRHHRSKQHGSFEGSSPKPVFINFKPRLKN